MSLDSVSLRSLSRQLWGGESRQHHLVSIVTSNVITTWGTVIPRRILRRIARTRKTRRIQNNIQKMHDLGNNKWTALAVTFYVFSDLYRE